MPEIYLPDSPPDFEHHPLCPWSEGLYEGDDVDCKCDTIYDDMTIDAAEARRDSYE